MLNVLEMAQATVRLKKAAGTRGGEYQGPCPDCGGRDRFHVWPEERVGGSYWCRQCGKGGDAIQFARDFKGLGFRAACDYVGAEIERDLAGGGPQPQGKKPLAAKWRPGPAGLTPEGKWQEKAQALVPWAFNQLMRNREQIDWLAGRGLNEHAVKFFRLGWNPADIFRPFASWGVEPRYKDDGSEKKYWVPAGLIIPWRRPGEETVERIRVRRPQGEPRYYVLPGSNMDCLVRPERGRAYVVVEAELDAMLVEREAGDLAGVVALGNSSRRPNIRTHRALADAAAVLVALDYDGAGVKSGGWWERTYTHAKYWPVPEGKDPAEAYQAGVDLREWVAEGLPAAWGVK